jgi:hypothetical protein
VIVSAAGGRAEAAVLSSAPVKEAGPVRGPLVWNYLNAWAADTAVSVGENTTTIEILPPAAGGLSSGKDDPVQPRAWPFNEQPRKTAPVTGAGRTGSGTERPQAGPGLFLPSWNAIPPRGVTGLVRLEADYEVRECVTKVFEPPRV